MPGEEHCCLLGHSDMPFSHKICNFHCYIAASHLKGRLNSRVSLSVLCHFLFVFFGGYRAFRNNRTIPAMFGYAK